MEHKPTQESQIVLPADLFGYDSGQFENDDRMNPGGIADQIVPKIKEFLKPLSTEDKKKAVELIDAQMYQEPWGTSEEAGPIITQVYKGLFLSTM